MSNENKKYSVLDKIVEVEPTGVIYSVKGSTIEEFVMEYLNRKNITGVSDARIRVRSEGRNRPEVVMYLFMDQNSRFISSEIQNVPAMLRNKVDTKGNLRITEEFREVLIPLCGKGDIQSGKIDREYFVRLDIFRVIGMMFAANPNYHHIAITDAMAYPDGRDSIISVIKNMKSVGYTSNNTDKRSHQIDSIERKNY